MLLDRLVNGWGVAMLGEGISVHPTLQVDRIKPAAARGRCSGTSTSSEPYPSVGGWLLPLRDRPTQAGCNTADDALVV